MNNNSMTENQELKTQDKLASLQLVLIILFAVLDHFWGWGMLRSWSYTPYFLNLLAVSVSLFLITKLSRSLFIALEKKYEKWKFTKKRFGVIWRYVTDSECAYVQPYCPKDKIELNSNMHCDDCNITFRMTHNGEALYIDKARDLMSKYFRRI